MKIKVSKRVKALIMGIVLTSIPSFSSPNMVLKNFSFKNISSSQHSKIDFRDKGVLVLTQTQNGDIKHYVVEIRDSNKLFKWIIKNIFSDSVVKVFRSTNYNFSYLNGVHFAIDIDWKRYNNLQDNSIHIYLVGNNQFDKNSFLSYLVRERRGVYLTVNPSTYSFKVKFEKMNFQQNDSDKNYLVWNGAKIECTHIALFHQCNIKGGYFTIGSKGKDSPGSLLIDNLGCSYKMDSKLLGEGECHLDSLNLAYLENLAMNNFNIEDLNISDRATLSKNQNVVYRAFFNLGKFDARVPSISDTTELSIRDFKLDGGSNNIKPRVWKNLIEKLGDSLSNLKSINRYYFSKDSLLLPFLDGNNSYDFHISLKYGSFKNFSSNSSNAGEIEGWKSNYRLKTSRLLNYSEFTKIDSISFEERTLINGSYSGKVKSIVLNYGIDNLYNPLPILLINRNSENRDKILNKMLNTGVKVYFSPLSIGQTRFTQGGDSISMGNMKFKAQAELMKNQVNMKNSMAPLMILGNIFANGKLQLQERDFSSLLSLFPKKVAIVLRTLAKSENGVVYFIIRFQNGGLTINGMPIPLM